MACLRATTEALSCRPAGVCRLQGFDTLMIPPRPVTTPHGEYDAARAVPPNASATLNPVANILIKL
jgi:hypothetical protein